MSSAATVPTLGQSPSNVRGRDAAKKVVAAYRRSSGLPDDVTWEEIKGENLKSLTASMCFWLASRPIPTKGFDENLQPTHPKNNQCLTSDTLVYYVGLWLTQVRDMFPQHEDFKESNPKATTPWWTEMRSGFAKAASKYQISQGDDVVFGLDKMLPLYKDNKRPIGDVITNPTSVIDVKHVLMHFVSTARSTSGFSLQTRCWIALTSDCIGRGGEFRFQSYDDWIWHPAIQVLDIKWKEMKNIHVYSMGIVPDLVHWLFDFYHCFGCYFMVENGLMRTDEEIKQGKVNVVFPSIFNTVESSSSRKLTAAIRSTISGPPDVKNRYSARSLRYGAITELALHRELSVFAGCARSGHSTGTTVDDYIDDNNPAYGLQAGMARCGYQDLASNLKAKIEVPRLEALGVEVAASVDELLSKVFIVHVPHFKKGQGKLHGVLRICLASLILYYPDVAKECGGGNIICTSLNKAAREAQIFDHRYGDTSPEALLGEWSKLIASDLASRRMPIPVINSDSVSLAAGLNQALSMLTGLTNQMQSLAQHNENLEKKIATQSSELASLREDSRKSAIKLSVLKTPQHSGRKRAKSENTYEDVISPAVLFQSDGLTRAAIAAPHAPAVGKKDPPKPQMTEVLLAARTVQQTTSQPLMQKSDFLDLLLEHRETLYLEKLHETPIAPHSCQRSALRYCFELLDYVVKHDDTAKVELQSFHQRSTSREEYMILGKSLVSKCMVQMLKFEGMQPDLEGQLRGKGRKPSTTYRGLGERVGNYKNQLIRKRKEGDPNLQLEKRQQELMLMVEVDAVGTPPGQKSVRSYFSRMIGKNG